MCVFCEKKNIFNKVKFGSGSDPDPDPHQHKKWAPDPDLDPYKIVSDPPRLFKGIVILYQGHRKSAPWRHF